MIIYSNKTSSPISVSSVLISRSTAKQAEPTAGALPSCVPITSSHNHTTAIQTTHQIFFSLFTIGFFYSMVHRKRRLSKTTGSSLRQPNHQTSHQSQKITSLPTSLNCRTKTSHFSAVLQKLSLRYNNIIILVKCNVTCMKYQICALPEVNSAKQVKKLDHF